MEGIDMSESPIVDEVYQIKPSPEAIDALDRLTRRTRTVRPPSGLVDAEAYRAWLFERVAILSASDVTEAERDETEQWHSRITTADERELWAEYVETAQ